MAGCLGTLGKHLPTIRLSTAISERERQLTTELRAAVYELSQGDRGNAARPIWAKQVRWESGCEGEAKSSVGCHGIGEVSCRD